jgi:hypothetical protein
MLYTGESIVVTHLRFLPFLTCNGQSNLQSLAMPISEIEGTLRFSIVDFGKVV